MAEKLLITQALDERDLLAKKINKTITSTIFVAAVREKDKKYNGTDIETLKTEATNNWNSIMDMIDRYERISRAIIQSNAVNIIKFSDGTEMTKAEAIAKKNLYKNNNALINNLINRVEREQNSAIVEFTRFDQQYTSMRQEAMNNLLMAEKNKELNADQIAAVETMINPYTAKLIDPIKVSEKLEFFKDKIDVFLSEVDTLIKVSNATSYIEF